MDQQVGNRGKPVAALARATSLVALVVVVHCEIVAAQSLPNLNLAVHAPIVWNQDVEGVEGTHHELDQFGAAIGLGDLNGDGFPDLIVGSPNDEVPGAAGRPGSVNVLYRDATGGLIAGPIWHQDSAGVDGTAEDGDRFGAALAVGDFDCDSVDDLAIGAPGEDVSSLESAGVVNVLYNGRTPQLFSQATAGVFGSLEADDGFGSALLAHDFNGDGCADLVVGSPSEDFGGIDSGVAHLLYGSPSGLTGIGSDFITAASPTADERFGEHFGIVRGSLWVGVPNRAAARGAIDQFSHDSIEGLQFTAEITNQLEEEIEWRLGQSFAPLGDDGYVLGLPGTGNDFLPREEGPTSFYPGALFAYPTVGTSHSYSAVSSGQFARSFVVGNLGVSGQDFVTASATRRQDPQGVVFIFPLDPSAEDFAPKIQLEALAGRPPNDGFGLKVAMGDLTGDGIDEVLIWDVDVLVEIPSLVAQIFSDDFESGTTLVWD